MTAEFMKICTTKAVAGSNPQVVEVDPGIFVLTYEVTADQTCSGTKQPSKTHAMTDYKKQGNEWLPLAHAEAPFAATAVSLPSAKK